MAGGALDLFRLDGKVALVTGGAGLLGRRYCEALIEAGAHVAIGDIAAQPASAVARELDPDRAIGVGLDVADEGSVQRGVDAIVARFGRLDILVNNAALTVRGGSETLSPSDYFAPFESYKRSVWERAVAVNLTGMLLCAQAAGRQMIEQTPSGGVMVNISSTYGVVAPDQRLYAGVKSPYADASFNTPVSYAVTKTAVLGLTRYLAT
ncbi:MAG: SDR family NAD(P)-dependent oxidoreductase, partial [Chloroflexi bacterium]|nr:SDR family NAD(P)-dependent oxidoreductase [Chloroflexota bacterium]